MRAPASSPVRIRYRPRSKCTYGSSASIVVALLRELGGLDEPIVARGLLAQPAIAQRGERIDRRDARERRVHRRRDRWRRRPAAARSAASSTVPGRAAASLSSDSAAPRQILALELQLRRQQPEIRMVRRELAAPPPARPPPPSGPRRASARAMPSIAGTQAGSIASAFL